MTTHKIAGPLLSATATLVTRRPGWVIAAYCVLLPLSVYVTVTSLELKTDQNDLVSADLEYNRRFLEFQKDFGDLEYLYVVIPVDGKPEVATRVAEAVAEEVSALKDHVQEVLHRIHPKSFGVSAFLLGPEDGLKDLARWVQEHQDIFRGLGQLDSFAALFRYVLKRMDPSLGDEPDVARWGVDVFHLFFSSILSAGKGEQPQPLEQSIERVAIEGLPHEERGYLLTGNLCLVEIMPKKNYQTLEVIREPLAKIREALDRVRAKFPGVEFGLTGRPVLQADEMATTDRDMTRATVVALVLVLCLFILFFRRLRRPVLAVATLVTGILLTFGLATLCIGYLTLLSVVFAAMLVGLGIDFGIQFLARYQEELIRTGDISGSTRTTIEHTGLAIWTCGITTSAAFFSTMFVHFRGLAELGFVAGSGLLICMVAMLTLLPALIVVTDRHVQRRRELRPPPVLRVPFLKYATRYPRAFIALLGAITLLGLVGFRLPRYNYNLLELQATGLESVEYELKFIEESKRSSWEAIFVVDSLEAVDRTIEKLKPAQEREIVGIVESVRDFVQVNQRAKIETLRPVAETIGSLRFPQPKPQVDRQEFLTSLGELIDRFDELQSSAASRGTAEDVEGVKIIGGLLETLEGISRLVEEKPEEAIANLSAFQQRWFGELAKLFEVIQRMLAPPEISLQSLPPAIRRRVVSADEKKFLVKACPVKNIWEEANMNEFIAAIRSVDENVTGVPVQVYESANLMRKGFIWAAIWSLLAVFVLIVIDFRDVRASLLTLVPLSVGLLWAFQVMWYLGLQFNLANFFALPILVGYGVTGGVQVIHRFREFGSTEDVSGTVSSAVSLSFLTTIVGFGCMVIAQHRGVVSLGLVTSLGCLTILLASIVLLPCLLAVFAGRKRQ